MTEPCLSLREVSLSLDGRPVAERISLNVTAGEILVLLGPSGCGKTSLLRLMAGLIRPDSGEILVNGAAPVPGVATAMVFQSYRLLPWKTIAGNIAFALPHLSKEARRDRVSSLLTEVGLEDYADAYPRSLSGGMKQRVALARALAARPDFLLMDEPFAALDAQKREVMQENLLGLLQEGVRPGAAQRKPGVVFVTHSIDEALLLGDKIILLTGAPGRVKHSWQPPWRQTPGILPAGIRLQPEWPHLRAAIREGLMSETSY